MTVIAPSSLFEELGGQDAFEGLRSPSSRETGPGLYETPDGSSIVGLIYVTDYKAEEEYGVGDLRKAITTDNPRQFAMSGDASAHIALFRDVNAIALATVALDDLTPAWGDQLCRTDEYAGFYERMLPYTQRIPNAGDMGRKPVTELKSIARELGIKPLPRRKSDLSSAIIAHPAYQARAENPNSFPAWFQNGQVLVMRADSGIAAHVVKHLRDAATAGTLGIGSGSGAFSTGLFFYDTRDETPALVAKREADFDWHDARLAELEPVKRELKARGFGWFFLGRPTVLAPKGKTEKSVHYWLNGERGKCRSQPCGWYTLEELLAEKFVTDANA